MISESNWMTEPRPANAVAWRGGGFSLAAATAAYWSLPGAARYRRCVELWFAVFCAGFCVLPGEPVQRALFYGFVPLTLPLVAATIRRLGASPLAWAMAAFLAYAATSALWSGHWLTAGDAFRKAAWTGYLLVLCCAIGGDGAAAWRRIFRAVQVFAALFALFAVFVFLRDCADCTRLVGFGAHANANYTASVTGALALLGLVAVLTEPGRIRFGWLAWQGPSVLLLVATGGRAALLAYLGGVVLSVALLAVRHGFRRAAGAIAAALAATGVAGLAALWFAGPWLHAEIGRGDTFRLRIWSGNVALFLQRPWFGHGSTFDDRFMIDGVVVGYHAHNLFLAQAFYGGVPGLLLWLAVFALAIGAVVRVWRASGDFLPAIPLFFLLGVGMVDIGYVLVDVQAIWLYVWVVLGIVLSYDVAGRRRATSA